MTTLQPRKIIVQPERNPTLQQRLKRVRVDTGFSQEGFARVLEVSTASYKLYETGKRDLPLASVLRILEIYELDANWFLLGIGER
jgi:transcriptional regulator with XRE-family HTH domain